MAELRSRGLSNPDAFLFVMPASTKGAYWQKPGDDKKVHVRGEKTFMLLAAILQGSGSREEARLTVIDGDGDGDAAFRQVLSRFRQDISSLTGRPRSEFTAVHSETGLPRLPGDLTIFGAVNRDRLQRR
ncbi:MAG: hypothetical protein ABI882_15225 [Acidobacteriota bacterium]